jgi:hypothetical protein
MGLPSVSMRAADTAMAGLVERGTYPALKTY